MTIGINSYTNGKGSLGLLKLQVGSGIGNYVYLIMFLKYTKQQPAAYTLIDALSVRTNNISVSYNVSNQNVGAAALYVSSPQTLSDTNFPATPLSGSLITNFTTLTSTAVQVSGSGSGKIRIVTIINNDTAVHNVSITIDGDTYSISISPNKQVAILMVNTPTTDSISLADPANTGKLQYAVVDTLTSNANTDSFTRTLTEQDAKGNTVDTGSISGTFYWLYVGISSPSITGSSASIGASPSQ